MSRPIPKGITADAVSDAAARLASGEAHAFGEPALYEAIVDGQRFAPKALIGLAAKYHLGVVLGPDDFHGGERPGEANWYLRKLNFDVVAKDARVGDDWTDDEAWVAVNGYFDMLGRRLRGEHCVKARFMRDLAHRTHGRSVKSVEFKLQNISAVLLEMGLTRLDGFAPAANYQTRLGEIVEDYLDLEAEFLARLTSTLDAAPPVLDQAPVRGDIEEAPPAEPKRRQPKRFRPRKVIDRAKVDAANRALGRAGECFVVEMERAGLVRAGRPDLSERVRWVSDLDGDGAGYDVLSFLEDGSEVYLEVKTTNGAKETPFFISANELEYAALHKTRYRLYRVFNFSLNPRLFVIAGNPRDTLDVEPILFRAGPRAPARLAPAPLGDDEKP